MADVLDNTPSATAVQRGPEFGSVTKSLADMLDDDFVPNESDLASHDYGDDAGDADAAQPGAAPAAPATGEATDTDVGDADTDVDAGEPSAPPAPEPGDAVRALREQLEQSQQIQRDLLGRLERLESPAPQPAPEDPQVVEARNEMMRLSRLSPREAFEEIFSRPNLVTDEASQQTSLDWKPNPEKFERYMAARIAGQVHETLTHAVGDDYPTRLKQIATQSRTVESVDRMVKADPELAPWAPALAELATSPQTSAWYRDQIDGMNDAAAARYMKMFLANAKANAPANANSATNPADNANQPPAAEPPRQPGQTAGVARGGRAPANESRASGEESDPILEGLMDQIAKNNRTIGFNPPQ